jgi:hypothetical protein
MQDNGEAITMKLGCIGLRRTVYWHELRDQIPIRASDVDPQISWALRRDEKNGDLLVNWVRKEVSLNGNYRFELRLTRADITQLLVAAYSDATPDECIEAVQAAQKNNRRK